MNKKILKVVMWSLLALGFFVAGILSAINIDYMWDSNYYYNRSQAEQMGLFVGICVAFWFAFAAFTIMLIISILDLLKTNPKKPEEENSQQNKENKNIFD